MRKVTLRLIRKFSALTGRNEKDMREWWKGLSREQKNIAGEHMKAAIESMGTIKEPAQK